MPIVNVELRDIFSNLNVHNVIKDKMIFSVSDTIINPKPFISVFVNGLLTFDYSKELNEGDQVVLSMAIAGG